MKQILVILSMLLVLFFAFECGKENKPTNPELESPSYYFPINSDYKWTYVSLGYDCVATGDSFVITAVNRNTRPEGSGWDLVSSASGGTSFVYHVADTIFYKKDVTSTLPPYKVLVGPIRKGTFWRDTPIYGYEYDIVAFEDLYSSIAGETYRGCAKIKRTLSGSATFNYFWWAPQIGKVKEAVYQSEQCQQGEELKRLDKPPHFP